MVSSVFLGGKYGKHLNISSVCSPSCCLASLQAFLFSPFHLCLVSVASKVYYCLGIVNSWHLQRLISNKCFKRPEHFLSGLFFLINLLFSPLAYFSDASGILIQDITFHWTYICLVCYKLAGSSFDELLQLTKRISSKLRTTQTSRTAWKDASYNLDESCHILSSAFFGVNLLVIRIISLKPYLPKLKMFMSNVFSFRDLI